MCTQLMCAHKPCQCRSKQTDYVAARLLVVSQCQQTAVAGVFEQFVEGPVTVIALGEPGAAPLEGLLDHRAPDLVVGAALGEQGLDGLDREVDGLLATFGVGPLAARRGLGLGRRIVAPGVVGRVVEGPPRVRVVG